MLNYHTTDYDATKTRNFNVAGEIYVKEHTVTSYMYNVQVHIEVDDNMTAKERFEDLFFVDYDHKLSYPGSSGAHYDFIVQRDTNLVGPDKLKEVNDAFFKNQNSQNIVIIFSPYSKAVNENPSWTADFELYLKIYPYYLLNLNLS